MAISVRMGPLYPPVPRSFKLRLAISYLSATLPGNTIWKVEMLALDDACHQLFCGGYALRNAARQGLAEDVLVLLSFGVNPDIVSRQQHRLFRPWIHARPALWHAVEGEHVRVVELLLAYGANPNVVGWMSSTPLWTACCRGQGEMVARLLSAGADPNLLGCWGSSPLGAWLRSLAVPHAVDPEAVKASPAALAIGELLSRAGARLDDMDEVLYQAETLLSCAGYPPGLLQVSRELQGLRAESQARLLQATHTPLGATLSRSRL